MKKIKISLLWGGLFFSLVFLFVGGVLLYQNPSLYSMIFQKKLPPFVGTVDDTPFDWDGCLRGESGSWSGACFCYPDEGWGGAYCDEVSDQNCQQDENCPETFYCNRDLKASACSENQNAGRCFKVEHYSPVLANDHFFIISRALMSWWSVPSFCHALGMGWRPVLRSDLNCPDHRAGCVADPFLKSFQLRMGIRGFLWLEQTEDPCQAYYVDLNDGNIYHTRRSASNNAQAVCVYDPASKRSINEE